MADSKSNVKKVLDKLSDLSQSTQNDSINKFVEKLIDEKQFDVSKEVRDILKQDLMRRLNDFITARILAALSDKDIIVFEKMLDDGKKDEELQKFVMENIPNFMNFLTATLLEFREVYLGLIMPPNAVDEAAPAQAETPQKTPLQSVTPAPVQKKEEELSVPVAPPAPAPMNPSLSKLN